jgi:hypothetical protein
LSVINPWLAILIVLQALAFATLLARLSAILLALRGAPRSLWIPRNGYHGGLYE